MNSEEDARPHAIRTLDDLLLRKDGTKRTIKEAAKLYGYRAIWVASLNSEILARNDGVHLQGYPPRIFISYRWENEGIKNWVLNLAQAVKQKGYEVLLDQFQEKIKSTLDVPKYVSNIADCEYALIVITPGYCEVAGYRSNPVEIGTDGWVLDEYQWVLRLSKQNRIKSIGILREGDRYPGGLGVANTVDMRDSDDFSLINRLLPNYTGPRITSIDRAAIKDGLDKLDHFISMYEYDKALDLLGNYSQYSWIPEIQCLQSLALAGSGSVLKSIEIADYLIEKYSDNYEIACRMATVHGLYGDKKKALRCLIPISKSEFNQIEVQYRIGNILDDLGSYQSAIDHLRYAKKLAGPVVEVLNDLGFAYRHDRQFDKAIENFRYSLEVDKGSGFSAVNLVATLAEQGRIEEALFECRRLIRAYPENTELNSVMKAILDGRIRGVPQKKVNGGEKIECPVCGSRYSTDYNSVRLCGDCGTEYEANKGVRCPCCANDGIVPIQMIELSKKLNFSIACPICREGALSLPQ